MIKRTILIAGIFALPSWSALAQDDSIYGRCASALEAGDTATVKQMATLIKEEKGIDPANLELGERCLEAAFSTNFAYRSLFNEWYSGEKADALEEKMAKEEKKNSILRKRVCYNDKIKSTEVTMESLRSFIKRKNEKLVAQITEEACVDLNRKDRFAAVLDPVCRQVFLAGMHPELKKDDIGEAYSLLISELFDARRRLAELNTELDELEGRSAQNSDEKSTIEKAMVACE